MCGIFGVIYRNPEQRIDPHRLACARDTLTHRGPDDKGQWIRPGIGLAHRRLAILDLKHGRQPWTSPDNELALTYNGEIYNFQTLMRDAKIQGAEFQTQCDTELLFHLLSTESHHCLDQLHGMFAFGFYRHRQRSLLLVRDRMGQKPLYWTDTGDKLIFASEVKAILSYTQQRYDLDVAAIEQFFTRGYVLSPRTIFKNINKLPAGHLLYLDADAWQIEVKPWWDATPLPAEELGSLDDSSVVDRLDELLTQSVTDRLLSDVPIGTLLSGGIDSSLITAMASRACDEPIKAFTVGFGDSPAHDETPYAKLVAEQYDCDWHCEMLHQLHGDWLKDLDAASFYYDEPFGNFTVTSQRLLSQRCREKLTVVLSGQGGDELSAGYPGRYNWILQSDQTATQEDSKSQYAPPVDDVINHMHRTAFVQWQNARQMMFTDDALDQMRRYAPIETIKPYWNRYNWPDRLGNILYTDSKTNLADYLICIEERASMSYSLEARNPMLDHRVVQYMLSLPARYKARPGSGPMAKDGIQNKWVLHALAKRYLPAQSFDRPKRGFTPPLQQWMSIYTKRIVEIFHETETLTSALYSKSWRQYLLNGAYAPAMTMAVYYSLIFALWIRRYADHISSVPGADQSTTIESAKQVLNGYTGSTDYPETKHINGLSHRIYRASEPEAIGIGRWFCQALRNFPKGSAVRLVGDSDDAYRWMVEQSGLRLAHKKDAIAGTVRIGMSSIDTFESNECQGPILLLFVPFRTAQQKDLNQIVQRFVTKYPILGHQLVSVSAREGVLIARCQPNVSLQ